MNNMNEIRSMVHNKDWSALYLECKETYNFNKEYYNEIVKPYVSSFKDFCDDITEYRHLPLCVEDYDIFPFKKFSLRINRNHLNMKRFYNSIEEVLSTIGRLNNLTKLNISNEYFKEINDVDWVSELTNLEDLRINRTNISNILGLENLTNLRKINLSINQLSNVESVKHLQKLTDVDFSGNLIQDPEPIFQLPNIENVDLESNFIKSLKGLHRDSKIKSLQLSNNILTSIREISCLRTLTYLYIDHCILSSLRWLKFNTKLEILVARRQHIHDIQGLDELKNLRLFNIYDNQIEEGHKTLLKMQKNGTEIVI